MNEKKYFVRDIPRRKFLEMSMKGGLLVAATPALLSQISSCEPQRMASEALSMDKETLNKVIAVALKN